MMTKQYIGGFFPNHFLGKLERCCNYWIEVDVKL